MVVLVHCKWNNKVKLMSVKRMRDTFWLQRLQVVSLFPTKPFSPKKIVGVINLLFMISQDYPNDIQNDKKKQEHIC